MAIAMSRDVVAPGSASYGQMYGGGQQTADPRGYLNQLIARYQRQGAGNYGQPTPYVPTPYAPPPNSQYPTQTPAGGSYPNVQQRMPSYVNPFGADYQGIMNIGNYGTQEQRNIYDQFLATIGTIAPLTLQQQAQQAEQALKWNEQNWGQRRDVFQQLMDQRRYDLEVQAMNAANAQFGKNYEKDIYGMNRQFAYQDEQNRIDNMYKQGLISNQQYENETGRLNAEYQNRYQQGLLGNQRFSNQTERIGTKGQLANTKFMNEATAAYQRGQLTNQQYANLTERMLGQGNLRLGQTRLRQEGAVAREGMRSNELQSRYQAFGRAQAPSTQWNSSWS